MFSAMKVMPRFTNHGLPCRSPVRAMKTLSARSVALLNHEQAMRASGPKTPPNATTESCRHRKKSRRAATAAASNTSPMSTSEGCTSSRRSPLRQVSCMNPAT